MSIEILPIENFTKIKAKSLKFVPPTTLDQAGEAEATSSPPFNCCGKINNQGSKKKKISKKAGIKDLKVEEEILLRKISK